MQEKISSQIALPVEIDLQSYPLFRQCEGVFVSALQEAARERRFEKGQVVFLHGDGVECFYIIRHGWVKLYRETLDGTQAVVDIFTTGHMFGETAIFEDGMYPYSAEAVEDVQVIALPIDLLKNEIKANNKLALDMLCSMARYRRRQDREIEHRSLQNASQRIGCFLLRLLNQSEDGAAHIHLPYDKMLVASRLGMQPETFSRALSRLRDKTGIRIKGSTVEIDSPSQLTDYSCMACSSEYPCKDILSGK
ncbi:MAG: Crp/Fnr family transcriptional regulator [Rhodospirillales bacterium]|nr:Crp/Fnr family transcriptional regulator [Rhodospirillales bacterium]